MSYLAPEVTDPRFGKLPVDAYQIDFTDEESLWKVVWTTPAARNAVLESLALTGEYVSDESRIFPREQAIQVVDFVLGRIEEIEIARISKQKEAQQGETASVPKSSFLSLVKKLFRL